MGRDPERLGATSGRTSSPSIALGATGFPCLVVFVSIQELPCSGILRLVGLSAVQQAEVTLRVIEAHGAVLAAGAIVTAEAGRLRLRLPGAQH
jgi:hypothetical protein